MTNNIEKLKGILLQLNPEVDSTSIDGNSELRSLGIDSLRVVELAQLVTQEFAVDIDSLSPIRWLTVKDILGDLT